MDWQRAVLEQAERDRRDPLWNGIKEAEISRRDHGITPIEGATVAHTKEQRQTMRANFRCMLQHQLNALLKTPTWLWEMEFFKHVWPVLETESRCRDDLQSPALLEAVRTSPGVREAVEQITDFLANAPTTPEPQQ